MNKFVDEIDVKFKDVLKEAGIEDISDNRMLYAKLGELVTASINYGAYYVASNTTTAMNEIMDKAEMNVFDKPSANIVIYTLDGGSENFEE